MRPYLSRSRTLHGKSLALARLPLFFPTCSGPARRTSQCSDIRRHCQVYCVRFRNAAGADEEAHHLQPQPGSGLKVDCFPWNIVTAISFSHTHYAFDPDGLLSVLASIRMTSGSESSFSSRRICSTRSFSCLEKYTIALIDARASLAFS